MLSRRKWLQGALAAPRQRRPNIVVLLSDDQRHDTIQALGNREIRTPNLDALVRSGTAFTHAYIMGGTSGAVCIPSRAMLLSGRTLFRADQDLMGKDPPERSITFPELLGRNGYVTFATGKWHNTPRLFARSFRDGENIFFGGMSDQTRVRVQAYDPYGRYAKERERIGSKFSTELFTDSAVGFLKSYRGVDPFLLYVAYTSPHDPRTPPRDFAYSPASVSLPPNFLPEHPFDNGDMKGRDEQLAPWPRAPEVVRQHLADYYGMISHLDAQVGRILRALEETGRARDTYVVFAADNGLAIGSHGLFGKQNLYEHSVRVPLVVSGPGIDRGRRDDSFRYLLDLYPTICEWAGAAVPGTVEGHRLFGPPPRTSLFFAYRHLQRAVRNERWKYIAYRGGHRQLFDLEHDRHEMKNLAGERRQAKITAAMQQFLKRDMAELGDPNALEFLA